MRTLFIALSLCIASPAWAQLQPPMDTQKSQRQSSKPAQKPKAEKQGTEKNPFVVKSYEAEQTAERRQQERAEREQKATHEKAILFWAVIAAVAALFAVLISAGQLGMFWRQLTLMRDSADDAKALATAATTQAEALKIGDRAWLSWVNVVPAGFSNATEINTGEVWDKGTMFSIQWVNSGRTPAVRCDLHGQGRTVDFGDAIPTFTPAEVREQKHAPILPNVSVQSPRCHFRQSDIEAMRDRKKRIFLYGRADYETVFPSDTRKHTEVCIEVEYGGMEARTGNMVFTFTPLGPQNSAS